MFQIIKKGLTKSALLGRALVKKLTFDLGVDKHIILRYNKKKKGGNKMDTMILLEMAMGFTLWAIVEVAERLFLDDSDS